MDRTPASSGVGDGKSDETCRARESSQRGQGSLDDRGAPQRGQVWAGFIEGSRSVAAPSSPATAVSAARNWSIYGRSSPLTSEGYKMFFDTRLESLKLKTYFNQVKFLPPKREAFHKRGGFCTGPSEYLNRLVSSEMMDGLRLRLARTSWRSNGAVLR